MVNDYNTGGTYYDSAKYDLILHKINKILHKIAKNELEKERFISIHLITVSCFKKIIIINSLFLSTILTADEAYLLHYLDIAYCDGVTHHGDIFASSVDVVS